MGQKKIPRLFPARPLDPASAPELHGHWFAPGSLEMRDSGINVYHLKMITPERRAARRDLYKALDPNNAFQSIGYDYLADEANAKFEDIPKGRGYKPPHVEDGGLWMPDKD